MFFGSDEKTINAAVQALKNGEIVAIPTETVYGLAADATSPKAVAKIFAAKGRPADNPLIVHICRLEDAEKIACPNPLFYRLAKRFWPGPLTMILPKKSCISEIVSAGLDTVAVRMPSNETARKILAQSGLFLAAPSANLSGKPSPTTAQHVYDDYRENGMLAGIVDGGECACGVESTVVSLCSNPPVLLRPGLITYEELQEHIPELQIASAVLKEMPKGQKAPSPGLLHRHYAPAAQTQGVTGSAEHAAAYIGSFAGGEKKIAVMCFDGEEKYYSGLFPVRAYGSVQEPEKMAQNIFRVLRELDQENVDQIFIRLVLTGGVGFAVYNRLLRSCAFQIKNTDLKPMVVGITGPSGAGKGTICKKLAEKGFYHIDTDKIARETVPETIGQLARQFGKEICNPDGTLNRKALAQQAFSSPEKTKKLNEITHTAIMKKVAEIAGIQKKARKDVLIDGAALLEAHAEKICDMVVAVSAPLKTRLARVQARDGISAEDAKLRFSRQCPDALLQKNCDLFILNDTNGIDGCVQQILEFINKRREEQTNGRTSL